MKTLHKHCAWLFVAAALILGAASADAAQGDNNMPRYEARPYGQQLTPQQMAQAQKIFDESFADMETTRQTLAGKRAELDQLLASPNPDGRRIETLSREIGELRGKMLSHRAAVRNKLASQGLPPDCFGPGYGPMMGGYGPMMGGYGPMMEGYGGPCWGDRGCGYGWHGAHGRHWHHRAW